MDRIDIVADICLLPTDEGGRLREPTNPFRSQFLLPCGSSFSVSVDVADLLRDGIVPAGVWHRARLTFSTLNGAAHRLLEGVDAFDLAEGSKVVGSGRVRRSV